MGSAKIAMIFKELKLKNTGFVLSNVQDFIQNHEQEVSLEFVGNLSQKVASSCVKGCFGDGEARNLSKALGLCCDCLLKRPAVAFDETRRIMRSLYHIFNWIQGKDLHAEAMNISKKLWKFCYLQLEKYSVDVNHLSKADFEELKTICHNSYSILWNATLKCSKSKNFDSAMTLNLLRRALQFHCLCTEHHDSVTTKLNQMLTAIGGKPNSGVALVHLFTTMLGAFCKRLIWNNATISEYLSLVYDFMFKWFNVTHSMLSAENVKVLFSNWKERTTEITPVTAFHAVKLNSACFNLIEYSMQCLKAKTKPSLVKPSVSLNSIVKIDGLENFERVVLSTLNLFAVAIKECASSKSKVNVKHLSELEKVVLWALDWISLSDQEEASVAGYRMSVGVLRMIFQCIKETFSVLAESHIFIIDVIEKSFSESLTLDSRLYLVGFLCSGSYQCVASKDYGTSAALASAYLRIVYRFSTANQNGDLDKFKDQIDKCEWYYLNSLIELGKYQEALEAFAVHYHQMSLLRCTETKFTNWCRIKRVAANKSLTYLADRTIVDQLKQLKIIVTKEEKMKALKAEIAGYHVDGCSGDTSMVLCRALHKLSDITDDPTEKCIFDVELCVLAPPAFCSKPFLEWNLEVICKTALDNLKKVSLKKLDNSKMTRVLIHKALAHFFLWSIDREDLKQAIAKNIAKSSETKPAPVKPVIQTDPTEVCDIVSTLCHVNLATEIQNLSKLYEFLETLESINIEYIDWEELPKTLVLKFTELIRVATEIFIGSHMLKYALRSQSFCVSLHLRHIRNDEKMSYPIQDVLCLLRLLNLLGCPMKALEVAERAKNELIKALRIKDDKNQFINDLVVASENQLFDKMLLKYYKAESLYLTGEISSSVALLSTLQMHLNKLSNTWSRYLLQGLVFMLLAKILSTYPLDVKQLSPGVQKTFNLSPATAAKLGLSQCRGLLHHYKQSATSSKGFKDNLWFLPFIKNVLLDSVFVFTQRLIDSGSATEVRCYLLECLPIAQEFVMTVRGAQLLFQLAHIDWLSDSLQDCSVKLYGIFHSMSHDTVEDHLKDTSVDIFDDSIDQEVLKLNKISLTEKSYTREEINSSPIKTQSIAVKKFPLSLIHIKSCMCHHCESPDAAIVFLRAMILQGKCFAMEGKLNDSFVILSEVSKQLEFLKGKYTSLPKPVFKSHRPISEELNLASTKCILNETEYSNPELSLLEIEFRETLGGCFLSKNDFDSAIPELDNALSIIGSYQKNSISFFRNLKASVMYLKTVIHLNCLAAKHGTNLFGLFRTSVASLNETHSASMKNTFGIKTPEKSETAAAKVIFVPAPPKKKEKAKPQVYQYQLRKFLKGTPPGQKVAANLCKTKKKGQKEEKISLISGDEEVPKRILRDKGQFDSQNEDVYNFLLSPEPKKVNRRRVKDTTGLTRKAAKDKSEPKESILQPDTDANESTKAGVGRTMRNLASRRKACETEAAKPVLISTEHSRADDENCDPNAKHNSNKVHKRLPRKKVSIQKAEEEKLITNSLDEKPRNISLVEKSTSFLHRVGQQDTFQIFFDAPVNDFAAIAADVTLDKLEANLVEICELIAHYPPTLLYARINLLLSLILSQKQDSEKKVSQASKCFNETVGLNLRHTWLNSIQNMRKANTQISREDDQIEAILSFNGAKPETTANISDVIPEDWTILQLCAVPNPNAVFTVSEERTPYVLLSRYSRGSPPLFLFLNCNDEQLKANFLKEFDAIITANNESLVACDRYLWWNRRKEVDKRLTNFCSVLEKKWLGCWKCFFFGKPSNQKRAQEVDQLVRDIVDEAEKCGLATNNQELLKTVVDGGPLSEEEISSVLLEIWNIRLSDPEHRVLGAFIKPRLHTLSGTQRKPLLIILDKHLQPLPWEAMPCLYNMPIFRIPSMATLHARLVSTNTDPDNSASRGIDATKGFYIVNPGKDLPGTEERMTLYFQKMPSWKGLMGQTPSQEEMFTPVTDYDIYLYSGHGSGRSYFGSEVNKLQSTKCRAFSVLMGCSSGRLPSPGFFEPRGIVLQYWIGGCPAIVSNLWNVTDKDIDRFTETFLDNLVWKTSEDDNSVTRALATARESCSLTAIIGCAPVVYGLPVRVSKALC